MPFSTRVIPERQDIKEVLSINHVKNILEKTAVSNMVGLLQQLNVLSQHASAVFSDLLADTQKSSDRIRDVKGRINNINNKILPIEKLFLSKPPSFFYDNPYTEQQWLRKDRMRGFLFRRNKAPEAINKRRDTCDTKPDLSALDQFTKDKTPCIKKYSDTEFFMNEWIEEQKIKLEEEKRKRKLRKEQRRQNRKHKRTKNKKIKKIVKPKYNEFGEKIQQEEKEDEYVEAKDYDLDNRDLIQDRLGTNKKNKQRSSRKIKQSSPQQRKTQTQQRQQTQQQRRTQTQTQQTTPQNIPPPINGNNNTNKQQNGPPKISNTNTNVPPPIPNTNSNGNTSGPPPIPMGNTSYVPDDDEGEGGEGLNNGPPPPIPNNNGHQPQPSYMGEQPKFGPSHVPTQTQDLSNLGPMTPQMRLMESRRRAEEQQKREEQERKLKEQEYEKQKQKANMMVGIKSNNLLAGIKSGVKLKKIDPNKIQRNKPKDTRSLLMQSLQKGAKLKKVNKNQINKKKKDDEPQEGGIFEILKRRQLIADSSDEDDSGSSWGSDSE